jgi:hypothetical protein
MQSVSRLLFAPWPSTASKLSVLSQAELEFKAEAWQSIHPQEVKAGNFGSALRY